MKFTKFTHSCILVEMPDRTALFDPGTMSRPLLEAHDFEYLDDIFITHRHPDHMDVDFIKQLTDKFPDVRITAPSDALQSLRDAGVAQATDQVPEGVSLFDAPHAHGEPLLPDYPNEYGYHYLNHFSHPGDSHTFMETSKILALPVTAPWGSTSEAVNAAIKLKPDYVIPVHDWFWHDDARHWMYDSMHDVFAQNGITFIKTTDGEPFNLEV